MAHDLKKSCKVRNFCLTHSEENEMEMDDKAPTKRAELYITQFDCIHNGTRNTLDEEDFNSIAELFVGQTDIRFGLQKISYRPPQHDKMSDPVVDDVVSDVPAVAGPVLALTAQQKRIGFARRAESLVERKYIVNTDKSGELTVTVQGDLSQQEKRAVFITVHDLGCNHQSFQEFVNSPCMTEIKERSCFIHIDVPGHADNADPLPDNFPFPSLQSLGEDLITVLDFLHVKYVLGLGEGAGANVLARFGLAHPSRLLGLILINATGSAATVLQSFRNKFIQWKSDEVAQSAESFLMYHKFGHQLVGDNPDKEKIVVEYQNRLHRSLNSKNVGLYVKAFMNRKDLTLKGCKVDVILITGMLSPYASMVEKLHRDIGKEKVTMLKIERAGDVLADAPAKVAQSILLFCKGQGLLTSVVMPGVDRGRAYSTSSGGSTENTNGSRKLSRGISMEDYDKPNIRRLSIITAEPTAAKK